MTCTASLDGVRCDLDAGDVEHFRHFAPGDVDRVASWVLLAVHLGHDEDGDPVEWPEAS